LAIDSQEERGIAMKSDLLSKLSASFFVLVMALSTLVVIPATTEGQTPGTNDILVPVLNAVSLKAIPGATVTLTNVHSGKVIPTTNTPPSPYFVALGAPSGYYKVDVKADGFVDKLNALQFRFEALTSLQTSSIQLQPLPPRVYAWNITVLSGTTPILGATVGLYDDQNRELVISGTTNAFGYKVLMMFDTTGLGTYYLYVQASEYQPYLQQVNISGPSSPTVSLTASSAVFGSVSSSVGTPQNVVAYLLNQNPSIPWIKRLLRSPATEASFRFDAYPGTYYLSIRADNLQSHIESIVIGGSTLADRVLQPQTQRLEPTSITFGSDYSTMTVSLNTTWAYDEPFPGMLFSDAGSLRMQIDLNSIYNSSLGAPDGTVSPLEATNFENELKSFGPKNVTTAPIMLVNRTSTTSFVYYKSVLPLTTFYVGNVAGPIGSTSGVVYSYSIGYTLVVPTGVTQPPVTSPQYSLDFLLDHDTAFVNRTLSVTLMPGFERVPSGTIDATLAVSGYTTFVLDPLNGTGAISVQIDVEKGKKPIAKGGMDESDGTVYALKNGSLVLRYFVRVGANATFTANSSSDPNGNPLTFIWQYGDGNTDTTANKTIVHVYATAQNRTANLTVQDVSGLTNTTSINVTCDARDPRPHITLNNRTLVGGKLYLKQGEAVIMNATGSYDDARTDGDGWGIIDHIQFIWGDGNSTGRIAWTDNEKNVTKAYAEEGTYTVWLNVTDVTGHHKNVSMTVQVNDTESPRTAYVVKNASWGTTLVEQQTLYFIATTTTDNTDTNISLMHYSWSFGDGKYDNGTGKSNVTHAYDKLGSYTVNLNVTDTSDNYLKVPKVINVVSKPRPNLRIDNATFKPDQFTEGKSGTIIVNITNVGDATATGISITFYLQQPDGSEELLTGTLTIMNGSSPATSVLPGGKIQAKFVFSPSASGTFVVTVNATATDQLEPTEFILSGPNALVVHQAAWKAYALWGGVIGVIILVPLLIYLSRRWSKREKKGPRREKKSEEKEE
jgi:PKD repeat protein